MTRRHDAAFRVLLASFPVWDVKPATLDVWDLLMSDVEPEHGVVGALRYAREVRFPPNSIAEWRQFSLDAQGTGQAVELTPAEAWDELERNQTALARMRYETRPEVLERKRAAIRWSSEACRRAAESVEWNREWEGEVSVKRGQFERAYAQLVAKRDTIDKTNAVHELVAGVSSVLSLGQRAGPKRIA